MERGTRCESASCEGVTCEGVWGVSCEGGEGYEGVKAGRGEDESCEGVTRECEK